MATCLVTKLKASTNNDNLPFFGQIVFHYKRTKNDKDVVGFYISSNNTKPVTLTILGDNDIVFTKNNAKTLQITSQENIFYSGGTIGDNVDIVLYPLYYRSLWQSFNNGGANANNNGNLFDSSALHYHDSIKKIGQDNGGVKIYLEDLVNSGNVIEHIQQGGTCNILGNMEDYLVTIWENGRKNGNLILPRSPGSYPHRPSDFPKGDQSTITVNFSQSEIVLTFYNKYSFTLEDIEPSSLYGTATYDGTSWNYVVAQ